MTFAIQILAFFLLVVLPFAVLKVDALNYVSVDSGDGNFQLKWAYNNGKLIFNMTCKTTGWCAVGFTTNPGGRSMVNYDITLGGVAFGTEYLDVSMFLSFFFFKGSGLVLKGCKSLMSLRLMIYYSSTPTSI